MYRRRYHSSKRREELRGYLQNVLAGLSVICIIIVCIAVAVKTRKATQTVEAEAALMQAQTVTVRKETVKAQNEQRKGNTDGSREEKREEEQQESVIIIDPGHGGVDGGCVFDEVVEKDVNRMIAAQVVVRLNKMGYQAELARVGDEYIDKMDRVENANRKKALLYVSIHQNSCEDDSVAGIETWYDGSDTARDSGRLAQLIQQETVRATGAVSRELVSESELCVTSKSTMPACLIETGFLSNREEREKLVTKEYREQIADGIANGIALYLNHSNSDEETGI